MPATEQPAHLEWHRQGPRLLSITVGGDWLARPGLPTTIEIEKEFAHGQVPQAVEFNTATLQAWDSGLLIFLFSCAELCRRYQVDFKSETLPAGARQLLRLAQAVPERKDASAPRTPLPWTTRVGDAALRFYSHLTELLGFIGTVMLAATKLFRGRAQFRWSDTRLVMQECGPEALAIVALINCIVGLILAFVGAVQLTQFGASIYVADLVAIGTVREMGCLMTGIIVCGRTGAAFAAQLGTMKVNEEIDAFRTLGISPIEFLVLPRVIALLLMMPLLTVFADLIAILGGFAVSVALLDVGTTEYIDRTIHAIQLESFLLGIFKGGVFGLLVALAGCWRGMRCGNSAAAVGQATTSAVVAGITSIVAADGIFAVLTNALGI